ncbi:MAG TPA: DUF5947 family protein [Ktedonobacteraceae bacterium]|jgi:hypothetical protein
MPESPPDYAIQFGALRRFTRTQKPTPAQLEHCELCGIALAAEHHHHLLHLSNREVVCACNGCAILFQHEGSGGGKYRTVPDRFLSLQDFRMTDEQWNDLLIPVNMVYIFWNQQTGQPQAFYPGPAGATASLLSLENWQELVHDNPILQELEPDVEALLINRVREAQEYFLVPIDACYRLVGLIRISWRGLSGGEAVWAAIAQFFAELRAKATAQFASSATLKGGESDAGSEF